MEILWKITPQDIETVQAFCEKWRDDAFVQWRIERNLGESKPQVTKVAFWKAMVSCLLTTQQRSGPGKPVTRFIDTVPFPLAYDACIAQDEVREFAEGVLSKFGGIRRSIKIAEEIEFNLMRLEQGLWPAILAELEDLRLDRVRQRERQVAEFIDDQLKGFGPKQSRNLLQQLGLTRYEIPIDSRITKWLNSFGFPIWLSSSALSDRSYYNLVSDGIQQLCEQSDVYPCVLDAAIFASFDRGGWSEMGIAW